MFNPKSELKVKQKRKKTQNVVQLLLEWKQFTTFNALMNNLKKTIVQRVLATETLTTIKKLKLTKHFNFQL